MALSIKKQIDYFVEFKDWYFKILKDFNFDYQKDCEARNYLSEILNRKSYQWNLDDILNRFNKLIKTKNEIIIYGCGPSLQKSINYILKKRGNKIFHNWLNFAADGAAVLLKEKEIPIDGIFSDLDGITSQEFIYAKFNIVHAHGDNIDKLNLFERDILNFNNVIGTTQVEPVENLINPGGFTDGDRILFFLKSFLLPYQSLFLIGMDFEKKVGKYSKPFIKKDIKATKIKSKKLKYAKELIEWLINNINNDIFLVNSESKSPFFKKLSLETFLKTVSC